MAGSLRPGAPGMLSIALETQQGKGPGLWPHHPRCPALRKHARQESSGQMREGSGSQRQMHPKPVRWAMRKEIEISCSQKKNPTAHLPQLVKGLCAAKPVRSGKHRKSKMRLIHPAHQTSELSLADPEHARNTDNLPTVAPNHLTQSLFDNESADMSCEALNTVLEVTEQLCGHRAVVRAWVVDSGHRWLTGSHGRPASRERLRSHVAGPGKRSKFQIPSTVSPERLSLSRPCKVLKPEVEPSYSGDHP